MDKETFEKNLELLVAGVWYISESEHPFIFEDLGKTTAEKLAIEIAAENNAPATEVKKVEADAFFSKIEKSADPADAPVVANAKKVNVLYTYLQEHLTNITVYRVESGTKVPIYIVGFLPDGNCIGVKTHSIES